MRGAMELLRTIAYQPGGSSTSASTKMCEQALSRACSGESRRKKPEEQQQHHHSHTAAEVSRIITDPTTGKRYCRGKVLGKVNGRSVAWSCPRAELALGSDPRGGREGVSCLFPPPPRTSLSLRSWQWARACARAVACRPGEGLPPLSSVPSSVRALPLSGIALLRARDACGTRGQAGSLLHAWSS